jgi:hypothetical protein
MMTTMGFGGDVGGGYFPPFPPPPFPPPNFGGGYRPSGGGSRRYMAPIDVDAMDVTPNDSGGMDDGGMTGDGWTTNDDGRGTGAGAGGGNATTAIGRLGHEIDAILVVVDIAERRRRSGGRSRTRGLRRCRLRG